MRFLGLIALCQLACFAPFALSFGLAGSLERIFAFSGYQLEEIMGGPYTIAPDCAAFYGTTRCNLKQFLQYVWDPDTQSPGARQVEADRPQIDDSNPRNRWVKQDVREGTIRSIQGGITSWKSPAAQGTEAVRLNKFAKADRIASGAVSYAFAIRKVGARISAARAWIADPKNASDGRLARAKELTATAKKAITGAREFRLYERDNNVKAPRYDDIQRRVQTKLNLAALPQLALKDCPNTAGFTPKAGESRATARGRILDTVQAKIDLGDNGHMLEDILWDHSRANAGNFQHVVMLDAITAAAKKSGC